MFLVLGNVTIDESMAAPRWPAPGQTIIVGAPRRDLGGKGVNQAIVLSRTGAPTRLVAAIGGDAEGDWVVARLQAEGLPADLTRHTATDRSLIFISPEGENAIASTVDAASALDPDFTRAKAGALGAGDVLMMQGNLTLAATQAALAAARAVGALTVFNPSPIRAGFETLLPLVDLLIVNEGEAERLGGSPQALREAGAGAVALTLGARGSVYLDANGALTFAAPRVEAIDTTGAGDAFAGVLVGARYHRLLSPEKAIAAATAAAALTVQRRGASSAFPSAQEIEAFLSR